MTKLSAPKIKSSKEYRQHRVLLGLVEHYLKTAKPVGSNTLREAEFEDLSSATIRNYFANLEELGYLEQQHASGGRIPTHAAFRAYANEYKDSSELSEAYSKQINNLAKTETREIARYLQEAAETLSQLSHCAVFISAPRFDQDSLIDVKVIPIDVNRCVCILVSDFGVINTEVLHLDNKMSSFAAKRIESYFHWRLTGTDEPENLTDEERSTAHRFYNEVMLRYIVGYANFTDPEIYRTGFSKLLSYPEFGDTLTLAGSLSLFENAHSMRLLLKDCSSKNSLQFWIGNDLKPYAADIPNCTVITHPYRIHNQAVGAIGIMGPTRLPYRQLFPLVRNFADAISTCLTRNIYKYKISFRQPEPKLISHKATPLIDHRSNNDR